MNARTKSGIVVGLIMLSLLFLGQVGLYLVTSIIATIAIVEVCLVNLGKHKNPLSFFLYLTIPAAYIAFTLIWALPSLRWNNSIWLLITVVAGTASYDIMAFFVGKEAGKYKIAPKISPNKTWEGTLGGFMGPFAVVAFTSGYHFLNLSLGQSVLLALAIGVLAFLGDLIESWYKRKLQIKDMGKIIPGHGGILDRIDSHLLSILGIYCLRAIF